LQKISNLKTHNTQLIKNWLAGQKGRIEFIFTPFHGSWLNQIEIWFGILEKKCIKRMDVASTAAGQHHTLSFIDTWNIYYAKPFNWKFTAGDLKDMLFQEPIKLPC
jgi:transposase